MSDYKKKLAITKRSMWCFYHCDKVLFNTFEFQDVFVYEKICMRFENHCELTLRLRIQSFMFPDDFFISFSHSPHLTPKGKNTKKAWTWEAESLLKGWVFSAGLKPLTSLTVIFGDYSMDLNRSLKTLPQAICHIFFNCSICIFLILIPTCSHSWTNY